MGEDPEADSKQYMSENVSVFGFLFFWTKHPPI
jgi:hypothetical protein